MIDIVLLVADNKEPSNCYAQFSLNTAVANTVEINIKATDNAGKEYNYAVVPFMSANMYNSLGAYGFDGTTNAVDGTFVIDIRNVVEDINTNSIKNYKWTIEFIDNKMDGNQLEIKEVKIIDTLNNLEYMSDICEKKVIEDNRAMININM